MTAALSDRVPGARIRVGAARDRTVARAIKDAAVQEDAAPIVMCTHGRTGLGRLLIGSVTEAVMHTAPLPVVFVRTGQGPTHWTPRLAASTGLTSAVQG